MNLCVGQIGDRKWPSLNLGILTSWFKHCGIGSAEAQSGKVKEARGMIECAQQEMEVGLRDYLGLYSWNNVEEREEEQKKK